MPAVLKNLLSLCSTTQFCYLFLSHFLFLFGGGEKLRQGHFVSTWISIVPAFPLQEITNHRKCWSAAISSLGHLWNSSWSYSAPFNQASPKPRTCLTCFFLDQLLNGFLWKFLLASHHQELLIPTFPSHPFRNLFHLRVTYVLHNWIFKSIYKPGRRLLCS